MGPSLRAMNWKQHAVALVIALFIIVNGLTSGTAVGIGGLLGTLAAGLLGGYGLLMVFGEEPDAQPQPQ